MTLLIIFSTVQVVGLLLALVLLWIAWYYDRKRIRMARQFCQRINSQLALMSEGKSPSTCTECGQRKPRADSSPCGVCVSRHVRETREIVANYKGSQ